jgi:hypothetical protein
LRWKLLPIISRRLGTVRVFLGLCIHEITSILGLPVSAGSDDNASEEEEDEEEDEDEEDEDEDEGVQT